MLKVKAGRVWPGQKGSPNVLWVEHMTGILRSRGTRCQHEREVSEVQNQLNTHCVSNVKNKTGRKGRGRVPFGLWEAGYKMLKMQSLHSHACLLQVRSAGCWGAGEVTGTQEPDATPLNSASTFRGSGGVTPHCCTKRHLEQQTLPMQERSQSFS